MSTKRLLRLSKYTTIEPWTPPASMEADDAGLFLTLLDTANAASRASSGTDLFDRAGPEWLVEMNDTELYEQVQLVALADGEPVGFGELSYSRTTTESAHVDVTVHPDMHDDALEDAIFAELERIAREHGRTRLNGFAFSPASNEGARLVPPTGFGSVGETEWGTRLHVRHGFTLGQVTRVSLYEFAAADAEAEDRMLDAAWQKAGEDYRVVWWTGHSPDEFAESYARANERMDIDAPAGGNTVEADTFTVEKLRHRDEQNIKAGRIMAVTLVVHEPSGEVAAFNELVIEQDRTRHADNWNTLVMPEHRGHRLGAIVKCEGLRRFHELVPESPSVVTFNAEENRFMLDVNEQVGFRPVAYAGEWQKELS
ncbi:MAG: GNAT family N-acetyltransferase [Microbacterium sp.]